MKMFIAALALSTGAAVVGMSIDPAHIGLSIDPPAASYSDYHAGLAVEAMSQANYPGVDRADTAVSMKMICDDVLAQPPMPRDMDQAMALAMCAGWNE